MASYHVGQKVEAYFESTSCPEVNGFYGGTISRVIREAGFANRYDISFDDGDKARMGSQEILPLGGRIDVEAAHGEE
jgi:hypothetical protein